MEEGILIRDASNFKFLDERFFRLAIKDRKSNDRVIETLREILEQKIGNCKSKLTNIARGQDPLLESRKNKKIKNFRILYLLEFLDFYKQLE